MGTAARGHALRSSAAARGRESVNVATHARTTQWLGTRHAAMGRLPGSGNFLFALLRTLAVCAAVGGLRVPLTPPATPAVPRARFAAGLRAAHAAPRETDMLPLQLRQWNCVGIMQHIDTSRPYRFCVGELDMVAWFQRNHSGADGWYAASTVNVCPHMGAQMHTGSVLVSERPVYHAGTRRHDRRVAVARLRCPYHGKCHEPESSFGTTLVSGGRLWWTCNPVALQPFSVYSPAQLARAFVASERRNRPVVHAEYSYVDMPYSMRDSAVFLMDLENHHKQMLRKNGCEDDLRFRIEMRPHAAQHDDAGASLSAQCLLPPWLQRGSRVFFHLSHHYPAHTCLRIVLPESGQCVTVDYNLLPLEHGVTRWYVTVHHNMRPRQQLRRLLWDLGVPFSESLSPPPVQFARDGALRSAVLQRSAEAEAAAFDPARANRVSTQLRARMLHGLQPRSRILRSVSEQFAHYEFPDEFAASRMVMYYEQRGIM